MTVGARIALGLLLACKSSPEEAAGPNPEAAMVADMGDHARLELFEIDEAAEAHLLELARSPEVRRHEGVISVPMDADRGLLSAPTKEALKAAIAESGLELPETHRYQFGRTLGVLAPDQPPEVVFRVEVSRAEPFLTSEHVRSVETVGIGVLARFDSAPPGVMIEFDEAGARTLAEVSKRVVGRRVAMVIDGQLYSDPVVIEPLSARIHLLSGEGPDTESVAKALAAKLSR